MHDRKRKWWAYLFITPQMIGLLAFSLGPLLYVLVLSVMDWDGFGAMEFVGLGNFIDQFNNPHFRTALINTIYYSVLYIPGAIIFALLIALALNRIKGKDLYRVFYFAPVVTSSVAVGVVWMWILNDDIGLINQTLANYGITGPGWLTNPDVAMLSIAILSIWWQLGYNMVIFLAGLSSISPTYYEAADIDGASTTRKFWHITLPLLSPTMLFITVMAVITSFQVFDQAFVITQGGPAKASYTMVYHVYEQAFVRFMFGSSAAAAIILFVIILSFTLVQFWASRRWVYYEE